MSRFKLLIVEDDPNFIKHYQVLIEEYQTENPITFDVLHAGSLQEASALIHEQSFDGAIVDLKLSPDKVDTFEGNEIIEQFTATVRCPVIVFSANHMNLSEEAEARVFDVISRDQGFEKVLRQFGLIHRSGLSSVMRRDGLINDYLNKIYWDVLRPRIGTWTGYAEQGKVTQDAMLRLALNHLVEFIEKDNSCYFPDEAYLHVFDANVLRTGQLFKDEDENQTYIILSPACDIEMREDGPNSEFIQLCRVYGHNEEPILSHRANCDIELPAGNEPGFQEQRALKKNASRFLKNAPKNGTAYFHYLPGTGSFAGGVINFREIYTVGRDVMGAQYVPLGIQVSPPFLKDIIGRYSSYYSRQGQPNFDFGDTLPEELLKT